jgi:hypothetical protein
MTDHDDPGTSEADLLTQPPVQRYMIVCVAGLLAITVVLLQRDLGWWSLFPLLVGGASMMARWSVGPPTTLFLVAVLVAFEATLNGRYWHVRERPSSPGMDLLLCAGVLVYVVSSYRLLSLVQAIFPHDPHRPPGIRQASDQGAARENARPPLDRGRRRPPQRRSVHLASSVEIVLFFLGLALVLGLAVVLWIGIVHSPPPRHLRPWYWRGNHLLWWRALHVAWVLLLIPILSALVRGYLGLRNGTPEEALVYLQDQLWRETRSEQANLNRWLVWKRLLFQKRKEKT